jgi:protein SCO1
MLSRCGKLMAVVLLVVGYFPWPAVAHAQLLMNEVPEAARGIDVEDRVGEFLPLDLKFTDERGNRVGLGRYFRQGKPVVLTLNYSDCPGLCVAQLDNLVYTLRELNGGGIGEKFDIVTVSIDPQESHTKAAGTKKKYTGLLRTEEAERGWHFLTGDQASIKALADAVGFKYSYDKQSKRYSHPAVTYFVSQEGRICRYFVSLGEEPQQFRFAIAEASEGKLTQSLSDMMVQMCFSYDPSANRYTASARRLLSFAAGAFTLMILGLTAPFWFTGRAAKQPTAPVAPSEMPVDSYTGSPVGDEQHFSREPKQ